MDTRRTIAIGTLLLVAIFALGPVAAAQEALSAPSLPPSDPDTVLVHLARGVSKAAVFDDAGIPAATAEPIADTGWLEVSTEGRPVADVLAELNRDPGVAQAEPNVLVRAEGTVSGANDPIYKTDAYKYLRTIRVPQAWTLARGNDQVKIAILDTGIDLDHPDLVKRLDPGTDIVNGDGSPGDDNGHGTFVAGVAAATTNNRRGVASPVWRARIIPVKVLNSSGVGKVADIARGLDWAVTHGADVINMSFGGTGTAAVMDDAVARAVAADVVVVAGTGNDSLRGTPTYPAALPGVIAVGATDRSGVIAGFSNTGSYVDLVAPGVGIRSTYWARSEAYGIGDGTSFSTPLVASTAGLVLVKHPTDSAATVSARLIKGARDAGAVGPDAQYGNGILDAYAALAA